MFELGAERKCAIPFAAFSDFKSWRGRLRKANFVFPRKERPNFPANSLVNLVSRETAGK